MAGTAGHLAGIWVLISFPFRSFAWTWWADWAFGLFNIPAEPNLFIAAALLVLGSALRRRLRAAYLLLLVYQVCATLADAAAAAIGLWFWNDPARADLDLSRTELVLTVVAVPVGARARLVPGGALGE